MKPSFPDIIPPQYRRRALWVTLSVFMRALLNFAGLAVLVPVLVIILDTEGIHSNRWLAAIYDAGGFTNDRMFILAVCGFVVATVLLKSLINLTLYKVERNFIYDLYHELSRRLYVGYRNQGLGFIKKSNSAILARNVNVVCLTFVTGVLMPVAAPGRRGRSLCAALRGAGHLQPARRPADSGDLRTVGPSSITVWCAAGSTATARRRTGRSAASRAP